MRRLWRWLVATVLVIFRRREREPDAESRESAPEAEGAAPAPERIVPEGTPNPRGEIAVIVLLLCAAVSGVAFSVLYAIDTLPHQTQYLGIALGVTLGLIAAALLVASRTVIVTEEIEEDYPGLGHPDEHAKIDQLLTESGSRITRKRLLGAAGAAAAGGLGAALVTPALSLGPLLETKSLDETPWTRGRRLVDDKGRPWLAQDIEQGQFYTAYPEGADRDQIGSPVVVVQLDPGSLKLPADRTNWAPNGILAYSKICTHAGCAIALYRKPLFPPVQPRPALVCPCHYSTFDPARAAEVIFGPAGRPLPQLPLEIDPQGQLRAGGNFSGPVGPSWSGVRDGKPT